jgi:type IV pilus assembly protein PilC
MKTAYVYSAWAPSGRIERGVLGADSRDVAAENLRERGLRPYEIRERGNIFSITKWFVKRPIARLAFFRAFAALSAAGATPSDTFALLVQQARARNKRGLMSKLPSSKRAAEKFANAVEGLGRDYLSGMKLQDAMAMRPNEFSEIESAMCEIGEQSGEMPKILTRLSIFLERDRKFSKQLGDALIYPSIVAVFAFAMIVYMVVSVIPQFASLYVGFGVNLPPIMQLLLGISALLKSPIFFLGLPFVLAGALYIFGNWIGTPEGAQRFDRFRLSIPVVGELIEKVVIARLCDVLSMLFAAGRNPLRAIEICIPIMESPVYARYLSQARDLMENGQVANVYEAFVRTGGFEPLMTGFMQVGVRAGNLDEMLTKISQYYEEDIASLTAAIPTVVQTTITIIMGGLVGIILYAIYVPISSLVTQIHQ